MNEPQPVPTWPLTLMAFLQSLVATMFFAPLSEAGGPWDWGYVAMLGVSTLLGLTFLGLAVRNCSRIWRSQRQEASWTLVVAAGGVAFFAGLVASGPVSIGRWRWDSLVWASLSGFLLVVLVRELRRLLDRRRQPGLSRSA